MKLIADNKWRILVALNIAVLIGLTFFVTRGASHSADEAKYSLLARRIFLQNRPDLIINFSSLREELREYLASLDLKKYSFYFEYLPTGTSIKIYDDSELVAASLMKVFLVMNLYKAHELGRIDIDQEVTIPPELINEASGPLWKRGAGTRITLRQAAKITLEESDNTASQLLFTHVDGKLKDEERIFSAADITPQLEKGNQAATINAKSYSSVFKCLYFSCFLELAHSQEILKMLSEASYDHRISAGVPSGVPVANKYGTYSKVSQSDCGIVYVPKREYVLCAMLWTDSVTADREIAELSKMVYEFVASQ
jgi:beta-lactamase class A